MFWDKFLKNKKPVLVESTSTVLGHQDIKGNIDKISDLIIKSTGNPGELGLIYMLNKLGRKFPEKSIIQYLPEVFGWISGKILEFTYLAFIMGVLIINSRLIVLQNETFFLLLTPSWAVMLLFLVISAFIAYQGIEGITRLAGFAFPVTFFLCLISIVFSFQSFELDNIRPIFFIDGLKIPLGTLQIFYPFVGLSTVMMLYPYLIEKQKALKAVAGAATLAFFMVLALMLKLEFRLSQQEY